MVAGKTLLVSAFLFGAYLLVSGIAQVVFAFGLHTSAGSRILLFISGAASLILAILAFRHFGTDPTLALWLLAIWIAVGFIFRGVATTATAISELHGTPGAVGASSSASSRSSPALWCLVHPSNRW